MKLDEIFSPELYAQIKARIEAVNAAEPNKAKHVKLVDLSEGGYISADKYNDKTGTLSQQVADLQGQLAQRDTDMTDLQTKLTAAQADASKLSDAQQALAGLQTKYESEKQEWATKIERQAYEYDIRVAKAHVFQRFREKTERDPHHAALRHFLRPVPFVREQRVHHRITRGCEHRDRLFARLPDLRLAFSRHRLRKHCPARLRFVCHFDIPLSL